MDLSKAKIRLDYLLRECAKLGWDGQDSLPVHIDAISRTECLLNEMDLINHYLDDPFISPLPSGGICLEFTKASFHNELVIDIQPNLDKVEFLLVEKWGSQEIEIEGIIDNKEWSLSRLLFKYCGYN